MSTIILLVFAPTSKAEKILELQSGNVPSVPEFPEFRQPKTQVPDPRTWGTRHVHLLMSEPEKGNPSKVMQVLKQKASRALRRKKSTATNQLELRFDDQEEEAPAFWQRRFYDFNVWGEKKLRLKLEYMHRNPVDRKLVKHPKEWPWSSWRFYETGEGLIGIDIAGSRERASERQSQNPHP